MNWAASGIRRRLGFRVAGAMFCAGLLMAGQASAQTYTDRNIDEIKVEAQARAERGAYPLIGLDPADVRDALSSLKTRAPDEWAAAWSAVAQRYYDKAEKAVAAEADAGYVRAWRLFYFAQWPVASSEGKKQAYGRALEAYQKHARFLDPPLEVVKIPFENSEIVAYMRLPKNASGPVPLVLAISGLDSRKETMTETYAPILGHGIGFIAVDGPGTGQSPVKVSETSERVFARLLDYIATRPEIDKTKVVVHGVSFGGYWAAKLAITEHARLQGVVAQSPAIHNFFQAGYLRNSLLGNREYLFDQVPALVSVFEGTSTVDQLAAVFPKMSLLTQGLIGKPTAPMLVIGGVKDTQVPISDIDLLMHSGDVPKDAWINPSGGHLGREPKGWTDPVIFREVIMPWEVRVLGKS